MRRLLATVVVVGGVVVGLFVLLGVSGSGSGRSYRVVFDNAFGLVSGGDFRVGGVKAGKTTGFDVERVRGHAAKAVVKVQFTEPGFDDFRADASCEVKPQSLIGEYYVDCQSGSSPRRLATDGSGTVPVSHTASTIPTDLVNDIMRRPYRERLRLIIDELGTGLAGRPEDLQQVLRRSDPGLRETTRVLGILGRQNRVIENFIRDSDQAVGELADRRTEVSRWVKSSGDAAAISATRSAALRANFNRLPVFLAELRPTMARLEGLIDAQRPLLGELRQAAPSLTTFFTRLGPFSQASRPALRSLGKASVTGSQAFRAGQAAVSELNTLAPKAKPTFKPLRQFLQTMDDRRRAIDSNDQRAAIGGPPAPDPTHIGPGANQGFTGLEAIWNYPFWQTLSINGYDNVGHLLRIAIQGDKDCAQLHTEFNLHNPADKAVFDKCSQWLGPNLPGITTPDFSSSSSMARLSREAGRPAVRVGERRGSGQPELGPVRGQADISRPQVVLPPRVKELLDRLAPRRGGGLPGVGRLPSVPSVPGGGGVGGGSRSAGHLLDFLLGP